MKKTFYSLHNKSFERHVRFALLADLHSKSPEAVLALLREVNPDYILMAGDMTEALDGSADEINANAFEVFAESAKIAPTFYCTGNHEDGGIHSQSKKWKKSQGKVRAYTKQNLEKINLTGVRFLCDSAQKLDGINFGGLASGLILGGNCPNLEFLEEFSATDGPKILLCHHPEYYEPYIRKTNVDIIVSGHAHGGQWRIFGRGVYSPGQGLFPKYTSGVHDGRLVITKGLKPSGRIPRIFNPTELVIVDINDEKGK